MSRTEAEMPAPPVPGGGAAPNGAGAHPPAERRGHKPCAGTRPAVIPGYEGLQACLDRFYRDHPDYDRNVFVMMRFRGDPHYHRIFDVIKQVLEEHGLEAMRVDQKSYPDDDDLWNNIVVYMMGCKYGIAVFKDFDERDFNANVAIEWGFMRALNKRVLILKEQRMTRIPSDVTGNRYRPFDMMNLEATIREQVLSWLCDIDMRKASRI
jgi:hypothetical protein